MLTLIDWLLDNTDCYYIDFLPETMISSDYFEIEEFFYDTYIKDFSKKIVRIIVKILGYYPAQIYLTEFPDKIDNNFKSLYPVEEDIRNKPLKELAKIISYVIINDVSSVNIILGENEKSLISVKGGFSIDIYNISEERLKLFNTLIEQENLFLRKEGEAGKIDGFKAGAV